MYYGLKASRNLEYILDHLYPPPLHKATKPNYKTKVLFETTGFKLVDALVKKATHKIFEFKTTIFKIVDWNL